MVYVITAPASLGTGCIILLNLAIDAVNITVDMYMHVASVHSLNRDYHDSTNH